MNLKEIREEINSALDYNPDLQSYKDSVARTVNRHYLQISGQYQWLFMQKKIDITGRAEETGSATQTITSTIVSGAAATRRVDFTSTGSPAVQNYWEGQTLVIGVTPYEIMYVDVDNQYVIIDTDLVAAVVPSASADWKVQFKHYPLPSDCVDVLGIMDRAGDRGRITFIDARKEEAEFLDIDDTGDPAVVIEDEWIFLEPPVIGPTLAAAAAGGLTSGNTYQYCYTYYTAGKDHIEFTAGRESPPSPVTEITLDSDVGGVTITMDGHTLAQTNPSPTITYWETGIRKRLYRRDKTGGGVWRLVTEFYDKASGGPSGTGARTSDPAPAGFLDQDVSLPDNYNYKKEVPTLDETGPKQYLRWWNTVSDATKQLEFRYLSRPRRLTAESDTPVWPTQYHHLLVYRTLEDICLQHGMVSHSQLYERKAVTLLDRMKARYLSRSDRPFIRQGFDRAMVRQERWGIPTKT